MGKKITIHIEDEDEAPKEKQQAKKKEFKTLGERMADSWWSKHTGGD